MCFEVQALFFKTKLMEHEPLAMANVLAIYGHLEGFKCHQLRMVLEAVPVCIFRLARVKHVFVSTHMFYFFFNKN